MSLLSRLKYYWVARQRRRFQRKSTPRVIRQFLEGPLPSLNAKASTTPIISIDLEMSGLDCRQDKIISIGWVRIEASSLKYGSAKHYVINQNSVNLNTTAKIHELFHKDLQNGKSLSEVLEMFLTDAEGCIWLFHHAKLDLEFLQRAFAELFGCKLPVLAIDTLLIERQLNSHKHLDANEFSLSKSRERYGLPTYKSHNAAVDAIATAELYLAQLKWKDLDQNLNIADLI